MPRQPRRSTQPLGLIVDAPVFTLNEYARWEANATLESWKGFQSRGGNYGSTDSMHPSDGLVRVLFAPEGRRGPEPLNHEELALISWVFKNEVEVSGAAQKALLEAYPDLRAEFGFEDEDGVDVMPDISSLDELKGMVGLHSVYVHQICSGDVPYIGFELGCSWDDEHGLGILMHGTRTVKLGGADTAFLLWIAKRDAKQQLDNRSQE